MFRSILTRIKQSFFPISDTIMKLMCIIIFIPKWVTFSGDLELKRQTWWVLIELKIKKIMTMRNCLITSFWNFLIIFLL